VLTFVMDSDELQCLVANARWFAGYFVRWKLLEDSDKYRVTTNYPWVQA
jgi:hypothetical protein